MRVLIAPDDFRGTLTAQQVVAAITAGWLESVPTDQVQGMPLSDGGPGFLTCLPTPTSTTHTMEVNGPLGEPIHARFLLDRQGDEVVAIIESAEVCGLHLVPPHRRDPRTTTTTGLGQLLMEARQCGATRAVVGVGGTATNDGGAGLLHALSAHAPDALTGGGAALADLTPTDLHFLENVRQQWQDFPITAAVDVQVPLLGLHGASAGFAEQKGATAEQAQHLEHALSLWAHLVRRHTATRPDLSATPGAGAGGGIGFGLSVLGATVRSGADVVLDHLRFNEALSQCDLVVTGEGCFDWQSLRGKVVSAVAQRAAEFAVPVVVVAGRVEVGRREMLNAGIHASYALDERDHGEGQGHTPHLVGLSARVATQWSHG